MITILLIALMLGIFGKLFGFALKAAWGIGKMVFSFILLPIVILVFIISGLLYFAVPILVIAGLIALFKPRRSTW